MATEAEDPDREGPAYRDGPVPRHRIPGFEVLGVIGSGGMGVVYKARQASLDRLVALKALPPALAADPLRVQRFRNEAAVAARLRHSRILPVYDVLDVDGAPVLVMPYIEGSDLGRIVGDRRAVKKGRISHGRHPSSTLPARGYLEMILPLLDQAIEAVAVLHEAGVVHRDIKPSNLLVDRNGEVYLSDFGLSRLNEGARITLPNQGMGTPGYMAPEQWEGASAVDERADVFGLGATLYVALTLEVPYGSSRIGIGQPPPVCPSARTPTLTADFDVVILKALEPDRDLRYPSAAALREDWRRVRAGEAPLVRPRSRLAQLARRARRHPVTAAALVAVFLLSVLMAGLAWRLSVAGPPAGPQPRSVRIRTAPPGARVAVALLDPITGEPRLDRPVFPIGGARTPAPFRLVPGDYLVEVAWDNRHFAQVFRHVPPPDERLPGAYSHLYWRENEGVIEWREVKDRVLAGEPPRPGMTRFAGSDAFVAPRDPGTGGTFPPRRVLAFDLDDTEVTMGEFLRPCPGSEAPPMWLPDEGRRLASDPREAVRFIDVDRAIHYAELRGVRLPTEAEYRFAASNGGRTLYPWGDRAPGGVGTPRVGPVGLDPADRLSSHPEVVGLRSNVAEWTTTRVSSFVPVPPSLRPGIGPSPASLASPRPAGERGRFYLVQGAPPSVALGGAFPDDFDRAPYSSIRVHALTSGAGVGFRCARSVEPYVLKTESNANAAR